MIHIYKASDVSAIYCKLYLLVKLIDGWVINLRTITSGKLKLRSLSGCLCYYGIARLFRSPVRVPNPDRAWSSVQLKSNELKLLVFSSPKYRSSQASGLQTRGIAWVRFSKFKTLIKNICSLYPCKRFFFLVGRTGFEPVTSYV